MSNIFSLIFNTFIGVEGKYCLHFHKLHDCPDCLFKNNAVENSQQRGIIVHGTHQSQVENNVLYNVRGAGIYIEDGNEMHNSISYNVIICNFPFNHPTLHGCTVPGTSNRIADTSDNQAGIFSRAATNNLVGNRSANSFNGMLLSAGGRGRGASYDKVCEPDASIGRIEGNTFHGNGRFGTYTLGSNYPKLTDQSIATDGHNIDQSLCEGFDDEGNTRGVSAAFQNNFDYHNAFVGHYMAGDIQYNGHQSHDNNNLIYWKETKVSEQLSFRDIIFRIHSIIRFLILHCNRRRRTLKMDALHILLVATSLGVIWRSLTSAHSS